MIFQRLTGNDIRGDRSYRSAIDKKFKIPSGITRGTSEAGHTDVLYAAFKREGTEIPKGHDLHHIVPKNDPLAEQAREILERNRIGIDDIENGIPLPRGANTPKLRAK
jgi:hypothetical protein